MKEGNVQISGIFSKIMISVGISSSIGFIVILCGIVNTSYYFLYRLGIEMMLGSFLAGITMLIMCLVWMSFNPSIVPIEDLKRDEGGSV